MPQEAAPTKCFPKIAVFWVVAPCSLVQVYRRFRDSCCLHRQGDEQVLSNFLHSITSTWRLLKFIRLEDHPPPWRHYTWSSATTDDVITLDAIYQWSCEVLVLFLSVVVWTVWYHIHRPCCTLLVTVTTICVQSISGLAARHKCIELLCCHGNIRRNSVLLEEINYWALL
jgi:hypothetical protein